MSLKVLLADGDEDFRDVTAYGLRRAGFQVTGVADEAAAEAAWHNDRPDIAILDAASPRINGVEVCRRIRRQFPTPIVLLALQHREHEIIQGLEAGAEDYLVKPISMRQLVLRLQAILRRSNGPPFQLMPHHLQVGPLSIDLDSLEVRVEGKAVQLTPLEFRLLYFLTANLGRVVPTSRLIEFGWGMDGDGDGSLLRTHFSHVRQKLQQASNAPIVIRSVPGVGYSLQVGDTGARSIPR